MDMVRGTTFRGTPSSGAGGLPGRVWTLLVWFMVVAVILTLSLVVPMNSRAEPAPRVAGLGFTLVSIALLVILRQRTPVWLLHALVITSIVWALLIAWLLVRTKSLGACIVAHATTNLLLGLWILATWKLIPLDKVPFGTPHWFFW